MPHQSSQARKILVIGDWVIDDNWLIGTHRSQTATNIGLSHYRSLNLPDNVVRRLSGAGQVATLLHAARGASAPESAEAYQILGVGLWDPDDKDYLRAMFNPDCMAGRTPYRVTSDELRKDQLPSRVELVSIEGLFDKNRVRTVKQAGEARAAAPSPAGQETSSGQTEDGDKPRNFGTTRVFRSYQQEGPEQVQLSRIDWELAPPYKQDGRPSWLREEDLQRAESWAAALADHIGDVDAVVVKDIGKGVVSQVLFDALLGVRGAGARLADKPWFISTRFWDPPWLKRLADRKVNIKLVFYSEMATRQAAAVPTWVTTNGKVTQEAIDAAGTTAEKLGPPAGRVLVAVNLLQLRTVALETAAERENWTCYVQPDLNPNESKLGMDVGRPSMMFGVMTFGLLQGAENGGVSPPMETKSLLEGVLSVTEKWTEDEFKALQAAPVFPATPEPVGLRVVGTPPDCRLAVTRRPGEAPEGLNQVGEITQFRAETAVKKWKRAMEDLGVLQDGASRIDYLQGWRATAELQDYVCCDPSKRRTLASLRDAVARFNPKHARRPLTALLAARPGAGKSFLVQSLANTLQPLRVLSFNITTMTRREDLLACFDQIVTTQSQRGDERLLVFFDEINACLENHPVYHAFLAPLEDGYYLRGGIKFLIRPCIWLFAGTAGRDEICKDSKGSDFISRLSFGEIDLTSRRKEDSRWQRIETVYLGVALVRNWHPDLRRVRYSVLQTLGDLKSDLSNRELRKFIEANFVAADGKGEWLSGESVYDDNDAYFNLTSHELRRPAAGPGSAGRADRWVYLYDD